MNWGAGDKLNVAIMVRDGEENVKAVAVGYVFYDRTSLLIKIT